ncbi:MAG: hypothetical protein LBT59_23885 [Clostridiales bacterium]|jgi:hypothetical protein|nr:hypothetical protein [Clostridiales bacterium]
MSILNSVIASILALIISVSGFPNLLPIDVGTEVFTPEMIAIPIASNVIPDRSMVAIRDLFYIYMKLSDIARLTNSTLSYEVPPSGSPSYAYFHYGTSYNKYNPTEKIPLSRNIKIDFINGTVSEGNNQTKIPIIKDGEDYYVEPYSILTALGASCSIENGKVNIIMHMSNFWEALGNAKQAVLPTSLTLENQYGSSSGANLRIGIDTVVDLFTFGGIADIGNPLGALIDFMNDELNKTVIEQSLYEDIDQYESVKGKIEDTNWMINEIADSMEYVSNISSSANDLSIDWVYNGLVDSRLLYKDASTEDMYDALRALERSSDLKLLSDMKLAANSMEAVKTMFEFTATIQNRLKVEQNKVFAINETFAETTLDKIPGLESPRFFGTARKVADMLNSNRKILLETTAKSLWGLGSEKLSSAIISQGVTKAFGKAAGGLIAALQIESAILSAIIPGQVKAAEADKNLYTAINQTSSEKSIMEGLYAKALEESFSDINTLNQLQSSYIVYYQTMLYGHKQVLEMIEKDPGRYGTVKDSTRDRTNSLCNIIAGVLHDLYVSQPTAVPKFSELTSQAYSFGESVIKLDENQQTMGTVKITKVTPTIATQGQTASFSVTAFYELTGKGSAILIAGANTSDPNTVDIYEEITLPPNASGSYVFNFNCTPTAWPNNKFEVSVVLLDAADTNKDPLDSADFEITINKADEKFSIEGKWLQTGEDTHGQIQKGSIIKFDGYNCNVWSPIDTYAFYQEGGEFNLNISGFLFGDVMTYKVIIIDNDNIELRPGDNSRYNTGNFRVRLKRVQ